MCLLVIIGVGADGTKELVALADGYRESSESWADLLRDCKRRGMRAPVLAVGDGALGFWEALREVFPDTREQRCWLHKIGQRAQRAAQVGPARREGGARRDLERRGPRPRRRARHGVRRRRTAPSGPRPSRRSPTTSTCCWPSTTTPPSTGSTCAPRTRSSRPSPPSGSGSEVTKGPARGPPAWRWRSSSSSPPRHRWRAVNAPHLVALVRAGATLREGHPRRTTRRIRRGSASRMTRQSTGLDYAPYQPSTDPSATVADTSANTPCKRSPDVGEPADALGRRWLALDSS